MRYATTSHRRNPSDLELVSSCRHDRLRAALSGAGASPLPLEARYEVATSAQPLSSTCKAYVFVVCTSMVSLVSLVIGGAATF